MKTQGEIKSSSRKLDTWKSPHFGDGGWHTTPGTQQHVTEWEPLGDRLLVRLLPEKLTTVIIRVESGEQSTYRRGIVLKLGTGYRSEDDKAQRQPFTVQVGDEVIIGQWHDWQSSDAGFGDNVVLCREPDVRVFFRKGEMAKFLFLLYDRVLLQRIEHDETVSGLIIPDEAKEKPRECRVVSVGPGHFADGKFVPLDVKAGDKVLIGEYAGSEITHEGQEYLVVREEEIQARIPETAVLPSGRGFSQ